MNVRIEHLERDRLSDARKLVWGVFPHQGPFERLSFWAIANQRSRHVRRMMAWVGIAGFLDVWGAIDRHSGALLGTTGLYQRTHDAKEAVWLSWFCVAPEARRKGIGSQLLDFAIHEAECTGLQYLRLYTSNRSGEAAAQILYESRDLKVVSRKRRLFHTRIYRERRFLHAGTKEAG